MALTTAIQIRLLAGQDQPTPQGPVAGALPSPAPTAVVSDAPVVTAEPVSSGPPAPRPPPPPPPTSIEGVAPVVTQNSGRPLAIEVGAGIIRDSGHGPLFTVPRLALSLGQPSVLQLRLAASGLGPGAEVSGPAGSAQLDRLIVTLGLVRFFRTDRRLQPLLSAGLGWQRLHAQGTSAMPDQVAAHDGQVSSALATLGGGVACTLVRGVSLLVEVEGMLFTPSVSVQVGSTATSRNGAALFARGGLLARF